VLCKLADNITLENQRHRRFCAAMVFEPEMADPERLHESFQRKTRDQKQQRADSQTNLSDKTDLLLF
jgi:hypothetical protein